ncbi:MAG TPA: dihydrofolate reductase family protein [Candidatus Saccharimonadales bacterium]|nr:dihydrofolate reductase family protein [Candidatus Saccharimonadales bacterium]
MGRLIYLFTTSLDGYVADKDGDFSWAAPTEERHAYINDILSNVGTVLMGRNLYQTMKVWDDIPTEGTGGAMDGPSKAMNDYSKIWKAANKIVYSTTMNDVTIANAKIEKSFDVEAVKKMIADSDRDVDIGGPHLAASAIKADIIDEYHQFIAPIILGEGNFWLPGGSRNKLELVSTHTFDDGVVHLHYRKA